MTKLDSIEIAPDIGTIVEATPEEEKPPLIVSKLLECHYYTVDVCKACLQRKAREDISGNIVCYFMEVVHVIMGNAGQLKLFVMKIPELLNVALGCN